MGTKENIPEINRLKYKKGELIVKEGDYGASIYEIVEGKVKIYKESKNGEAHLATLGPREIIGEITFLSGSGQPRSASAKALEDSELEVWHFSRLQKEYEQMPQILKYMTNQSLTRLINTNILLISLDDKKKEVLKLKQRNPWVSKRLFYRKKTDLDCVYRPKSSSKNVQFVGRIRDISLSGMGLEVSAKDALNFSHEPGDSIFVSTVLPNGKELELEGKVLSVNKDAINGKLLLGMFFADISMDTRKTLGFYLMP
jgi:hypothetical protein